jgi:hypothetical protein
MAFNAYPCLQSILLLSCFYRIRIAGFLVSLLSIVISDLSIPKDSLPNTLNLKQYALGGLGKDEEKGFLVL